MVKAAKGKVQVYIPLVFYETIYKPNGWRLVDTAPETTDNTDSIDRFKPSKYDNLAEELDSLNTLEDLKNFAENHGVNVEGITNRKAMRAAITNALNM